jgi:hypothetical protein
MHVRVHILTQLGVPACLHARVHASTSIPSIWGCTRGCWPCGHSPACFCFLLCFAMPLLRNEALCRLSTLFCSCLTAALCSRQQVLGSRLLGFEFHLNGFGVCCNSSCLVLDCWEGLHFCSNGHAMAMQNSDAGLRARSVTQMRNLLKF